ncbi:MAG: PAS domain S-box protein, partial [Rhodospirillales bacterium]|nr:PAS domain S-box protein [Rhodospirillales bacterium]
EMIMDHAADCIITIDDAGHMESVNAAVEALFGYSTEEMVGQSVSILMPEPYRSHHDRYIAQYVETGEGKMIGGGPRELVGQRKDGSTFPLEMSTSEVRAEGRRLFIGIGRDITLRKRTEDALRETEQRLRVIAGNLPGIVFQRLLKPDGSLVYTYVSEGSRDVLGIEPAALIADADLFLNMMEPHHRQRYMASLLRSAQTREPVDEEVRVTTPAGRVLWLRGQSRPRLLPSGDIAFDGLTLDVTDRKLAEERLRFLAYYDPVTGLANRSLFLDRFALARAHATSDGTSVAVLSLGIDRFSIINTTMGHAVGDQVLAALAQRLQSCLGLNDSLSL